MTPDQFRQIEELYLAARARSPEDRAALLARADPELRREVESLLAQPSGEGLLDRPAIQAVSPALEDSTVTVPTTVLAGTVIGRYHLLQPIGRGVWARCGWQNRRNRYAAVSPSS
jgi:hypothetical protein